MRPKTGFLSASALRLMSPITGRSKIIKTVSPILRCRISSEQVCLLSAGGNTGLTARFCHEAEETWATTGEFRRETCLIQNIKGMRVNKLYPHACWIRTKYHNMKRSVLKIDTNQICVMRAFNQLWCDGECKHFVNVATQWMEPRARLQNLSWHFQI